MASAGPTAVRACVSCAWARTRSLRRRGRRSGSDFRNTRARSSGGGNHRGSIFRLLVGSTLLKTSGAACPTWGIKNSAPHDVRVLEQPFEQEVSRIIGAMPFLWLGIDDAPGAGSMREYVERNAIALLSNLAKPPLDAAIRQLVRDRLRPREGARQRFRPLEPESRGRGLRSSLPRRGRALRK